LAAKEKTSLPVNLTFVDGVQFTRTSKRGCKPHVPSRSSSFFSLEPFDAVNVGFPTLGPHAVSDVVGSARDDELGIFLCVRKLKPETSSGFFFCPMPPPRDPEHWHATQERRLLGRLPA
jgi:hypothetical protein